MATYQDGTKSNPVKCFDYSMAFDICRERDCPTWCFIELTGEIGKAYPSGYWQDA